MISMLVITANMCRAGRQQTLTWSHQGGEQLTGAREQTLEVRLGVML